MRAVGPDLQLALANGRSAFSSATGCSTYRASASFDRSLDVQVSPLWRKLRTKSVGRELIKTVRGGG